MEELDVNHLEYDLPNGTEKEFKEHLEKLKVEIGAYLGGVKLAEKRVTMLSFEAAFWQFPRAGNSFHPSAVAKGGHCERECYFIQAHAPKNEYTIGHSRQLMRIFNLGTNSQL